MASSRLFASAVAMSAPAYLTHFENIAEASGHHTRRPEITIAR